jgi:hypothetical protein
MERQILCKRCLKPDARMRRTAMCNASVRVSMYVCIYVCMHVCMYIHTHECAYTRKRTCTYTRAHPEAASGFRPVSTVAQASAHVAYITIESAGEEHKQSNSHHSFVLPSDFKFITENRIHLSQSNSRSADGLRQAPTLAQFARSHPRIHDSISCNLTQL